MLLSGHLVVFFKISKLKSSVNLVYQYLLKEKELESDLILPGARQPFLHSFLLIRQKKGKAEGV